MSGNTSATGGFLAPTSPAQLEDLALEKLLQVTVAGVTGLDGTLVRPRWQPVPPNQPPAGTSWAAVGVVERTPDDYPYQWLDANEVYTLHRWERLEVLVSLYGPRAGSYAQVLRDGLYLTQNCEALAVYGVKLQSAGRARSVPELTNAQWLGRVDLPLTFTRELRLTYAVLSLLGAEVDLLVASPLDQGAADTFPVVVTRDA